MNYPKFFNKTESIKVYDELAEFLGSFENGIIEYTFSDMAKATGHGCITVAGAYLATLYALKKLYPNRLAERGKIKIELPQKRNHGTQGVIASVISHITGATSDYGFKGLAGKFSRTGLLFFNCAIPSFARFTRVDTGDSVDVFYNPGKVANPGDILGRMLSSPPKSENFKTYQKKWLETVETVLENADKVIEIKEV